MSLTANRKPPKVFNPAPSNNTASLRPGGFLLPRRLYPAQARDRVSIGVADHGEKKKRFFSRNKEKIASAASATLFKG